MTITVTITLADLQRHDACVEGIALWRSIATRSPKGRLRVRVKWTPLHDVWLAVAYPGFSGWLRDWGLVPRANLGGANLGGANLRGANLYGASLRGADLRGADLRGADLRGADLRGADLGGADLGGADLGGADLGGADLYGANLGDADLYGANLGDANLGDWERGPDGFARRRATP